MSLYCFIFFTKINSKILLKILNRSFWGFLERMDAVLEVLEKWLFLRSVGDLEAVLELSVFENCPRSGISYTTPDDLMT